MHSSSAKRAFTALRTTASLLVLPALAGCHGPFTYTLNDTVLYSPVAAANPANYVLKDPGLQACLNQLLASSGISDLDQVQLLACPGSGVEGLDGIDKLASLEQLELSDNKITELHPLANLKNLRVIGLRNNPVKSIRVLEQLQLLRFVSLQGDDQLPCKEVESLKSRLGNTLSAPDHCRQ